MAKYLDMAGLQYFWGKVKELLGGKVDKVSGKGLSTNDYTAAEKAKLTGIAANANNYVHPAGVQKASGLYKIATSTEGHVTAAVAVAKEDITALGIPAQDTNTIYSAMVGASTTVDGSQGLVPAPVKGASDRYLRSDGTWIIPPDTKYSLASQSVNGLMSSADKIKLDGVTAGAQANVIESVKINNVALSPASKAVNIDLSNYATKSDISSVYKVKGSKASQGALPSTGNVIGDVWNVEDSGANYVWTGTAWDKLSETVDLSGYLQKSEVTTITNAEIDTVLAS